MVYTNLKRGVPLFAACLLLFQSCKPWDEDRTNPNTPPEQTEGWAPIYDSTGDTKIIKTLAARNTERGGKIYIKDKILYQVETGKGIHVIDIADIGKPVKTHFIQIPGCQELSILDQTLYANNLNDLVVVDITDIANARLADRITNAFHLFSPTAPPGPGWYECINTSRGNVVGWELKTLYRPNCR